MTPSEVRPAIEDRLAAAGLPPLPRTAWLELDLDALIGNLALLRRLAGEHAQIRPVVKADAYGHGAVPIARALEGAGADGLCVATFDEAVELRNGGVRTPSPGPVPDPAGTGRRCRPAGDRRSRRGRTRAGGTRPGRLDDRP